MANIALGNINAGSICTDTVKSIIDCQQANLFTSILMREAGPYIDVARNDVVDKFRKDKAADWLLFVDSDIIFTPSDVRDLYAHAAPDRVVSGLYRNNFPTWGVRPVAGRWAWHEQLEKNAIIPIEPEVLADVDDDGLLKVDGMGAGFLLFHRQLVEAMVENFGYPMPWFDELIIDGVWNGEDYVFCLRAAQLGYPSYLVPSVNVGHIKKVRY